ncbi:MAG: SLBB domain-containing protein [Pyrinomonadaceae bacterium]
MSFLFWFVLVPSQYPLIGQFTQPTSSIEIQKEQDLAHLGDIIDVDVVGGFEFDWRGTLTPEGFLDGVDGFDEPVYGLCRTETQIAADVARAFSKILRDPQIVVRIIDRSNRPVARLEGAIRTPTRFRLQRGASLRELLILAGGLTDGASGEISVYRPRSLSCQSSLTVESKASGPPQDNGSQTFTIKISELIAGNAAANPQILSGDMIEVTKAGAPIYVLGAVNNPRPIYARDRMTASRVIAIAGGFAKWAADSRISIFRREVGATRIIEADLDKIKRGESDDVILKPFDIVDVRAKGAGKRKYPPVPASGESRTRMMTELPLRVVD